MMHHSTVDAIASEEMDAGIWVRLQDGRAYRDPKMVDQGGVVKRSKGRGRFVKGETIVVATDGGVLMLPRKAADVAIRGVVVRIVADEPKYVRLEQGRVIGFEGDIH